MEEFVNCVMELIMKLSDVEAFAVPVLEKVLPAKLAKSFFDKYSMAGKNGHFKPVKKLSTMCVDLIAIDKHMDTLYSIYGPDTNLPIPTHLIGDIHDMLYGGEYESQCKLALLLINNNYTRHHLMLDIDDNSKFGDWEERMWKKIIALAPYKLQQIDIHTEDLSKFPKYNPIVTALPFLPNFKNLQTLRMDGTPFNDNHFGEISQAVPNLTVLGFGFKKDLIISDVGIQALSCLAKLQEIHFDIVGDSILNQGEEIIFNQMNDFSKRCLKAMPKKLKIVKSDISRHIFLFEHLIPKFEQPTDLALEHLFIKRSLKKECPNSTISNVRYLHISNLVDVDQANLIGAQKFSKLETLFTNGGNYEALTALMPRLGINLKEIYIEIECYLQSGDNIGLDFLLFIDSCPLLEEISIYGGKHSFGHQPSSRQIPLHLKKVCICMDNPLNLSLPPGSLASLLQSPNLETFSLYALSAAPSDCFQLIDMLQSSEVLINLNKVNFYFKKVEENEAFSILLVAMATFCPHLSEVDITNFKKGVVLNLCSRLIEKLITLKLK